MAGRPTYFILFLLGLISAAVIPVHGQQVITFRDKESLLDVNRQVYFLEDRTGVLTLDDILTPGIQARFELSQQSIPNFANTRSAIWCRLTVTNTTSEKCYLQIGKSLIHHIEFFRPDKQGHYKSTLVGALHPINARDINDNFFLFELLPGNTKAPVTFYIRFASEESLEIPLSIGSLETLFTLHRTEEIIFGIFFGLMIAMILYNLVIYFYVREISYLYYVLGIFSSLVLNDMIICGIGFEYLWPNTPQINFYANALTAIVFILLMQFSASFLNTVSNTPTLHKGLYAFQVASGIVVIMNISGEFFYSSLATQVIALLVSPYLILTAIVAYRRKVQASQFYLMAWTIFLASAIVYVLFLNGLLPGNTLVRNATLIGSSLEGVLLSLALANRINTLRKEKLGAQQEKLKLIEEQNEKLERLVTERTHEIMAQNEEIASQNEELVTQQDQISAQNTELHTRNQELETAHRIIEEQHRELKQYSANLEQEINMRAKDLVRSNQELVEQNHQLEQFAFITAHNLRAPVARIQGLATILDLTRDEQERQFIVKKMSQSSKELDQVIHDLAKILEVKKGTVQNFEMVNLAEKMDRVKSMLQDDIRKTNATIDYRFEEVQEIFSLPQYIESILYNLVSNALKYKSPIRRPEIRIRTSRVNNTILLTVQDNGIGLDLHKYKEKIFGLYQRFHDHVEGKGLGLHLVKTQVESLGGNIDIHSIRDEGTTFSITLPNKS